MIKERTRFLFIQSNQNIFDFPCERNRCSEYLQWNFLFFSFFSISLSLHTLSVCIYVCLDLLIFIDDIDINRVRTIFFHFVHIDFSMYTFVRCKCWLFVFLLVSFLISFIVFVFVFFAQFMGRNWPRICATHV